MSLCDKCYSPGACCKSIGLSSNGNPITIWDDQNAAAVIEASGLPFVPLVRAQTWEAEGGRTYSTWRYSCPRLGVDGRCSQYEDRPDLCRNYEPRTDALCAMFHGESGDPTLGFDYAIA